AGEVEDGVHAREVEAVDRADVAQLDAQPRMRREIVAEPGRVDDDDVVIGPREQRLGQARAHVAAAAGDEDGHQMTIFPMVRNSSSVTGLSLQRRCAIAAAPMLPTSAMSGAGRPTAAASALSAKYASPQPIVSTTSIASEGSVKSSPAARTPAPWEPSVTDTARHPSSAAERRTSASTGRFRLWRHSSASVRFRLQ